MNALLLALLMPLAAALPTTIGHPAYHGCPVFPAVYGQIVSGAAVDPHCADYISSVQQAGDKGGFYASTGNEQRNLAYDCYRCSPWCRR
jgi:hypothetical protein